MIALLAEIAASHLASRGRQSLLSILGVALGVGFSIAMAALMQGSQEQFVTSLVDAMPHVQVEDEARQADRQPVEDRYVHVELRSLRPERDLRGIANPAMALGALRDWVPGAVAGDLRLSAVARFAGRDINLALLGIEPALEPAISTLAEDMRQGSFDALQADRNGIVLGDGVAAKLGAEHGDRIRVRTGTGTGAYYKIVGLFHTGVTAMDDGQGYVQLKAAQVLAERPNAISQIRVKLADAQAARSVASRIEAQLGYKSVSWQEANEQLLEAFLIRNAIMYTVVGAILLVAGFGIFNIVSTITHEKVREIAILKSLGFAEADLRRLFLFEGLVMGAVGSAIGAVLGYALTRLLGSIRFELKDQTEITHLPVVVEPIHYAIAMACALLAAGVAGYLPARRAASLNPVDIIRGAA